MRARKGIADVNLAAASIAFFLSVSIVDDAATLQRGRELLTAGDLAGAAGVLALVCEREPSNALAWQLYGFALHSSGRIAEALPAHEKAAGFPQTAGNGAYNAACACALLGRADEAFAWLDKARAAGFAGIENARNDPDFAAVRSDARFQSRFPPVLAGDELFAERPRILHTLVGEAPGDQFGWVARPLGDLDGDGVIDFATTAPTHSAPNEPGAGAVYVHSSQSGVLLFRADGKAGDALGWSVAAAGDVDGDGVGDVIAGAPGNARGRALVLSGKDGHLLRELRSGASNDGFGAGVCGLGDLDGDGRADVAVGSAPIGNAPGRGSVYAFSGADGSQLFALSGEAEGDSFGASIASDGDGPERLLVVGAQTAGARRVGRAYVYRPNDAGAELAFTIDPDATSANLGQFVAVPGDVDLDGFPDAYASDFNNGALGPATGRVFVHSGKTGERILVLTGTRAGEGFGTSPSVAGDVNEDGRADFIVGAWQNAEGAPSAGKCYLLSGADGSLLAAYTCRQSGDTFGFDAMGLGDVDGDGGIDFLLTSGWSPALGPRTGRTFVIAGPVFE